MTTINNYKTNKNYRQRQSLYNCHSKKNVKKKKSVHTIKKTLLTKLILDTAVTSEDLSHTTIKKSM
jgi:hypothetical protein